MSKQYRKGDCEHCVDSPVRGCTGTRVSVRVHVCTSSLRVKVEDCGVSGKDQQEVFAICRSLPKLPIRRSRCATYHVMAMYETSNWLCQVRNGKCRGARGVVVSHPLSMREALGSIPSVSNGIMLTLHKHANASHAAADRTSQTLSTAPEQHRTCLWFADPRKYTAELITGHTHGGVLVFRKQRTLDFGANSKSSATEKKMG